MQVLCSLCKAVELVGEARQAYGICGDCVATLGLAPMPEARRPPVPCMRCNGLRFVRAVPRVQGNRPMPGNHGSNPAVAVNGVTYSVQIEEGFLVRPSAVHPEVTTAIGTLEAYICTKCGYVDWYCWAPEDIPLGPQHMTELIDYERDAPPYR